MSFSAPNQVKNKCDVLPLPFPRQDLPLKVGGQLGDLAPEWERRMEPGFDALASARLGQERFRRLTVDRTEMPSLYATADLLLAPSPREAGPLAALEAMACNKPVVATADSARRELIGEGGLLVEEPDAESFAETIDRTLSLEWKDRPRRQALTHSLEDSAGKLGDLLTELGRRRG